MSMGPGAAGAGLIIGGCYVIVAGMDYCCTPNCLHKRGSGQEAILFLCTCLGDLASLARAADRADPEGVQMLSLRKRKHVQPFIHVSFHCQAKCFHCASSFLFLQPHGRPFAKTQNDANWKVIVGSQAPRSTEPDSDDVRDDGDDDFPRTTKR